MTDRLLRLQKVGPAFVVLFEDSGEDTAAGSRNGLVVTPTLRIQRIFCRPCLKRKSIASGDH